MKKIKDNILKPLFKYPGGKGSEYKQLKKFFPEFETYVEPFLGGGAVYWAVSAKNWIINDYSEELISIYSFTQLEDQVFFNYIQDLGNIWSKKDTYKEIITKSLIDDTQIDREELNEISQGLRLVSKYFDFNPERLTILLEESVVRKKKSLIKISKTTKIKNWEENALGVLGTAIYTVIKDLSIHHMLTISLVLKKALPAQCLEKGHLQITPVLNGFTPL